MEELLCYNFPVVGQVAKLVDAPRLGRGPARDWRFESSPAHKMSIIEKHAQ